MEAIIIGDLINSRQVEPSEWMPALKKALKKYGKEPKNWEIFRGDSFQLNTKPEDALMAASRNKTMEKPRCKNRNWPGRNHLSSRQNYRIKRNCIFELGRVL